MPTPFRLPPRVQPRRHGSLWPWGVVAILAVMVLTCGGISAYVIHGLFGVADKTANMPERVGERIASALKPEVIYNTQINSAIGTIKHTPKLVVNTYEIDVEIEKSVASRWAYVYWGTTVVDVKAHGNKVQYFVPVEALGTGNFSYDPVHKILHAQIPLPKLDEDVVEVQSDPSRIDVRIDKGWSRLNSGEALRDDALRELRSAVIQAGKGEAQQALAEKDARKTFIKLLDPVVQSLGGDVKVEIEFQAP